MIIFEFQAVNEKYVVSRLDDENQATLKQLIIGGQKIQIGRHKYNRLMATALLLV